MIKTIDNFLSVEDFKKIKSNMLDNKHFAWYYNDKVNDEDGITENPDNYLFTHVFYDTFKNSDFFYLIEPFVTKLNMGSIVKIKANLMMKPTSQQVFKFHKDCPWDFKWWTAIFYVNTNNGKTIFERGEEIESRENRLILFDGRLKHAGTTSTDSKRRILINFNYLNSEIK